MLLNLSELFRKSVLTGVMAAAVALTTGPAPAAQGDNILRINHYVHHVSTVPANAGQAVKLFVRERVLAGVARTGSGVTATGKVVLFVHGGTVPSVPDYDLDFKDYNWMKYLAQAGFDTFSMDQSGYGLSPRPTMDDPCNMNPADQELLIPNPLSAPCAPSYPFTLTNSQSDWDEIDTVVDYIRALRGVDKVSLAGWSGGGPRGGGYAARHPAKVDKLILYAPGYGPTQSSYPPAVVPAPGFPMNTQTYEELAFGRWAETVACENQIEPGIVDVIWNTIMAYDPLGATWGSRPGLMRTRTAQSWGWNPEYAAKVTAPTLIVVGQQDSESLIANTKTLMNDLVSADNKVRIEVACATHFLVWEAQHRVLLESSKNWLLHGSVKGVRNGELYVDPDGKYQR
jgi:pimeloyl-ACP methyl ester carboxylesterase